MQITLIRKNKLSVFNIPEIPNGNYWITDFENGKKINLLNVEGKDGKWQLVSNQSAFVVDKNGVMVPTVELNNYNFYLIKNNYKNETCYLYTCPVYDESFKEFGFNENRIEVGSDTTCNICYKLGGIPDKVFAIEKRDGYYYLDLLRNSTVYINQKLVSSSKRLKYGDVIFLYGLKVILMKKNNNDYLLVNNPNNLLEYNSSYANIVSQENTFVEDNATLMDDSSFKEINYFYRTPFFYKVLNDYELSIDAPPQKKEEDKTPVTLTIGPMITMSIASVVMLMSNISASKSGDGNSKTATTGIIMSGAMLASTLLWPLLTRTYQKISDKMYEKKRQKQYKNYLDKKEKEINIELENQRQVLLQNYLSIPDCQKIIKEHDIKLWQRRIADEDFLTLPLGYGNIPMRIKIKYPEEHFTLSEDNLMDLVHELGKKERILNDIPITYSFKDNNATGIVGEQSLTKEFVDRLVLQMMSNYSYDELKIVTFTSTDNEKDWEYMKVLPHSWSNDKNIRFFGSSNDDYREIIYVLEKIFNERKANRGVKYNTHYVIITDAIKSIDSYDFIKSVMLNPDLGFSIIMLVDNVSALPNECKNFINVKQEECMIFSSVINNNAQKFKIDFSPIDDLYACSKELANIPIDIKTEVESNLPDLYQFLEMYQVGKVEQLNIKERWKRSNPILSLAAPVGIGKGGEIISLDLHEKYHGPHGLIAGTTGSGKSEFIISYILSLAINYHPSEVQIILIDYKGGGLATAFQNDRYTLPHIAGTITNLDGNELNRSLASIESEVKRRQREFNDAKKVSNESTMDIYKYQKLFREGKLKDKEQISHLFIISDEFAELKEQQQEFMDKLISVARIGRSLGVHLILATQKPGGVVDQQIWSNSRFKVCFKVQDTSDSQEVLKKPDAAYLQKRGRFYLQVGSDEVYTLGQSSWSGGAYYPSNSFRKDVDVSVNAINNIGFITNNRELEVVEETESMGEELPNIAKHICEVADSQNFVPKKLWLDKIPEKIYIDNLKKKYKLEKTDYYINPIIGEYDDPNNQIQQVLTVPFSKLGNAIIYGIAGSGKEDFLQSLIYSSMREYTSNEVNFYILDFGSESLRIFYKSPYVGDIAYLGDNDKITNLFKMINNELSRRRDLFSNYGGSYNDYIKSSNDKLPNLIIILNGFESFQENYEDIAEDIDKISRDAYKYGIYFVVTANAENSIRSKIKQNFSLVYVLQQNSDYDYSNILGNVRGKIPSKNKGRGLFKKDNVYEFQTAIIKEDNQNDYIKEYCENDNQEYRAKKIPSLPKEINYEYVVSKLKDNSNPIVAVNKNTLDDIEYNFEKNIINIVSSQDIESTYNFINSLALEIDYMDKYSLSIINTTDYVFDNKLKVFTDNYNELINKFDEYTEKLNKIYEENNFNNKVINNTKKNIIIIHGLNDFINKLDEEGKKKLNNIISKNNNLRNIFFIIVDNFDAIKKYAFDEWFKNGADTSKGIWIGNGIVDQQLFKISRFNKEDRDDIPMDYGFVVMNSKIVMSKLLNSFKTSVK